MANDPKDRINLAALQQNDPYIQRIVETAGQVALYNFNAETNEWEKTDVQGTMFIYTRSAAPLHGFIIMNRLSIHNFTEPITKEMEFQLNNPFLLYKNADSIHGIWFYNRDQCGKVARTLEQLVHKSSVKTSRPPKQRTKSLGDQSVLMSHHKEAQSEGGSIDIIQMLSKAQYEYNQTKSGSQQESTNEEGRDAESQVVRPIPMRVDSQQLTGAKTPQEVGVMNVAQVKGQPHDNVPPAGVPKFKRSTSMQEKRSEEATTEESNLPRKKEQVPPLLQRLFSHSDASTIQPASEDVKTVESLERLHLSEIEGRDSRKRQTSKDVEGKKPIDNLLQMLSHSEEQASSQRTPVTPQSLQSKVSKPSGDVHSSHPSDAQLVAHEAPHRIALKGLNPSLMTPSNTLPEHTQSGGVTSVVQTKESPGVGIIPSSHKVGAGGDSGLFMLEQCTDSPEGATVPTSPQTIPASFTPSKLLTPSLIQKTPSSSGLLVPTAVTAKADSSQASRVSPVPALTKEQFKEAYIFMLQNDSEFVSKLYDAYLQVQSKPKT